MPFRQARCRHIYTQSVLRRGNFVRPAGAEYYDFETDSEGRYDRDGVHAYCYEKAGATYVYKDGGSKQSSIATKQAATINSFDGRRNEQRYSPHLCA